MCSSRTPDYFPLPAAPGSRPACPRDFPSFASKASTIHWRMETPEVATEILTRLSSASSKSFTVNAFMKPLYKIKILLATVNFLALQSIHEHGNKNHHTKDRSGLHLSGTADSDILQFSRNRSPRSAMGSHSPEEVRRFLRCLSG